MAHAPASIRFRAKPEIALEQIRAALLASVPPGVVLMDANYGNNNKLRQDLTGLRAQLRGTTKVRPVREHDPKPPRVSVEELALSLPKPAWRTVAWWDALCVRSHQVWLTSVDPNMSLRRLVDLACASSAIMRTSSRKSASGIMRVAAGRASIIAILAIAAYGFLISERERISP